MEALPSNIAHVPEVILKNYSKSELRMIPSTGSANVIAGDTVVFKLPASKVVDLASLRMVYYCETNGTATQVVGLPKWSSSLISQVEIFVNGISIQNSPRYNIIYNMLIDYDCDYHKKAAKLNNNSDPSTDTIMNAGGVITQFPTYKGTAVELVNKFGKEYVVDDWIGFLDFKDGNRQSYFNTNTVGDVEIHITWAPNSVLWRDRLNAVADPSYTVSNLLMFIDAIEFKDDNFVNALDSKLSGGGVHMMPFKTYKSYVGENTNQTAETTLRIVENTNSLDRLFFTYLDINRNTPSHLQLGDQTQILTQTPANPATPADATAIANNIIDGHVPHKYFNYEYLKATKSTNLLNSSRFFRRNGVGLGFNINNRKQSALIQYEVDSQDLGNPMSITNVYATTKRAFELDYYNIHKANPGIANFDSWLRNHFVSAFSLSHIGGATRGYLVSGIDTMATAISVAVKVTNGQLNGDAECSGTPMLVTEATSFLQIGAGRSVAFRP